MKALPSSKKVVSVFLDANGLDREKYFCSRCRVPVIEYVGSVIQEVPGAPPYTPYTILQCKGNYRREDGTYEECGRYYCFVTAAITKDPPM